MNTLWLGIISTAVAVATVFLVALLLELRKLARSMQQFLRTTEETIKPTLEEIQQTLKSIRSVSDDVNTVTGNIKVLSEGVRTAGESIQQLVSMIGGAASSASARTSALKVGIMTGFEVLLNRLFSGKEKSNE